jgi:hypothetical protein
LHGKANPITAIAGVLVTAILRGRETCIAKNASVPFRPRHDSAADAR